MAARALRLRCSPRWSRPMTADGAVDLDGAAPARRAPRRPRPRRRSSLNGTTGEAPTTTRPRRPSWSAPSSRPSGTARCVVAGAGSNDTAHAVRWPSRPPRPARTALLVVTPVLLTPVAGGRLPAHPRRRRRHRPARDALRRPGPHRRRVSTETFDRLAEHTAHRRRQGRHRRPRPRRCAASPRTGLAWYSGDDALLPRRSSPHGAVGLVSRGRPRRRARARRTMIAAFDAATSPRPWQVFTAAAAGRSTPHAARGYGAMPPRPRCSCSASSPTATMRLPAGAPRRATRSRRCATACAGRPA